MTPICSRFARKGFLEENSFIKAIRDADLGIVDADLGQGLIKLRVPRPNEGKSGGYRVIVAYLQSEKAFFLYGFAKNDRQNITPGELADFRVLAETFLRLSPEQIDYAIERRQLIEIVERE